MLGKKNQAKQKQAAKSLEVSALRKKESIEKYKTECNEQNSWGLNPTVCNKVGEDDEPKTHCNFFKNYKFHLPFGLVQFGRFWNTKPHWFIPNCI